ncbi:MAG TPA: CBS domain-containing protein [Candidatus Nitrosotenuis sp.]|nr:CBS domain-containing protein [Candidatus Nitrosotenuis sp.]
MSLDVIYDHFNEVMNTKIDSLKSEAILIDPSQTLSSVIGTVTKYDTFDVFCTEKGTTLNTNMRELLLAKDITDMKVRPFLHPVPSLKKGDTVEKAVNILTHNRIRAAPIVEDGQITGIVHAKEILKLISKLNNKWIHANQIFTPNPYVIDKKTPLSTARRLMTTKRVDHLPVVDGDKVLQVLTSSHILRTILPPEKIGRKDYGSRKIPQLRSSVGNLGTSRMTSCAPLDDLNVVVDSMLHADTTFCLVSLRNSLQGIITYRDILNLLTTKMKSTVPLFIIGMPKDDNANIITQKFTKALDRLQKVYPDVQEAKVYVKKHHGTGSRYNYEVSATIITPNQRHAFSRQGYDLSKVFDEISQRLLRLLAKRAKRRYKLSIRKLER